MPALMNSGASFLSRLPLFADMSPETLRKYRNDHIGGWRYRKQKVKVDTMGRTVRRGIQWSVHYLENNFFDTAD